MVSIILSTYNRAHTLKYTIDSILKQTYGLFELLIIDDGSTDATAEVLEAYKDERIKIFWLKENQYYCVAANFGIQKAMGKYIAFATSDDTWEPEKLELQIQYLEARTECGACFTFSDVIDENGQNAQEKFEMLSGLLMKNMHTRKEWIQHFIFEGNCLCHPSAVVRREVMNDVGGFNLLYCQSADMDLWIRIVRKYEIHVIEKNMVHYRCYKDPQAQISGAEELKAARFVNEHMLIRRNFINDLTDAEMLLFFGDCFRYRDAASPMEMEIEKAFLLMHCTRGLPNQRVLGIEKMEEILRNPDGVSVLKKKYQVGIKDIYEWNREHFYADFGIHVRMAKQDQKALTLQEELRKEKEFTKALQNRRDELWKSLKEAEQIIKKQETEIECQKEQVEEVRECQNEAERNLSIKEKEFREVSEKEKEVTLLLEKALLEKLELLEKAARGKRK